MQTESGGKFCGKTTNTAIDIKVSGEIEDQNQWIRLQFLPQLGTELAKSNRTFEATEEVGELADGATYSPWTFNGTAPVFIRRVGDEVELI